MAEHDFSKVDTRVRFPSPAQKSLIFERGESFSCPGSSTDRATPF